MAQASVLLVEDDARLALLIRDYLRENGLAADVEGNGTRAVRRILEEQPDAVVLDITLPGLNGLEICRQVREAYRGRILMLTARGDDRDQVVGLDLGADDYLPKPAKPRLLLARLHALLRRPGAAAAPDGPRAFSVDALTVDPFTRTCTLGAVPLPLSGAEFDLLALLAAHAGEVMSRDLILRRLRATEYDGVDRSVDLRVSRLRQKLSEAGDAERIKAIRGIGYQLVRR